MELQERNYNMKFPMNLSCEGKTESKTLQDKMAYLLDILLFHNNSE